MSPIQSLVFKHFFTLSWWCLRVTTIPFHCISSSLNYLLSWIVFLKNFLILVEQWVLLLIDFIQKSLNSLFLFPGQHIIHLQPFSIWLFQLYLDILLLIFMMLIIRNFIFKIHFIITIKENCLFRWKVFLFMMLRRAISLFLTTYPTIFLFMTTIQETLLTSIRLNHLALNILIEFWGLIIIGWLFI